MSSWALPEAYLAEWDSRQSLGQLMPKLGDGSRGPATIITSVLGVETAFVWFYDHPRLMDRFRDILADQMVELNMLLREYSGSHQAGWWITDDNCALFNRELHADYCVPVLDRVFAALAPGNTDNTGVACSAINPHE